MAAAWNPGIVGGPYKQSHIRVCDWKDLYRKTEKCLCSGAELLFLSRSTGACPIGSLQAVIGSWNFKMAYYIVGFLIFIGALLGRLVCGFLCNILSLEPDLTVCQLISGASHQRITQCGFTGTVWAHQDMCFSSVYLKVNAVKDLCVLYVDY